MATMAQFSVNMRKRVLRHAQAEPIIVKRAIKAALKAVVRATPVDTGEARSNWRVGVGAPTRGVIPPYAPGKKLGLSETGNASAAIAAGIARINTVKNTGFLKTALYLSNHTRHISILNTGHSGQASEGFIERAFAAAKLEIRRFRIFIT